MDLIIGCVTQRYATFSGRARRKEYWLYYLAWGVLAAITIGIDINAGTFFEEEGIGVVSGILFLVLLIPTWAVNIRRLHDTDRSGYWWLIAMIPLIGTIWFIVLMCLRGTEGENRFGPDPLASDRDGAPTNISTSSVTNDSSINDGTQDVSSSETPENNNSTTEQEQDLKDK